LRRKVLILAAAIAIFLAIAFAAGVAVFFSPLLTHYVETDAFRTAMEQEAAKGLHFPRARYAPIRRTGAVAAQSESLEADNGQKETFGGD
jgi:ABC-type sugar transport system substrate-binding protein